MTDGMAAEQAGPVPVARQAGTVLVAEREARDRQELGAALRAGGRPVIEVADATACLVAAGAPGLAAVVLGLDLPGLEPAAALVRAVRSRHRGRLVVTAAPHERNRCEAALAAGADAWVARPFHPGEVEERLRGGAPAAEPTGPVGNQPLGIGPVGTHPVAGRPVVRWGGDLELDLDRRILRRAGVDVALTPHELGLLEVLVANPGRLLSHEALLKAVWGPAYGSESAYLRTFMSQLRRKLGDPARVPAMIRTEPGLGYRWIAQTLGG